MEYKDTLNLPTTDFPMKANLNQREPEMLKKWDAANLYGQIEARGAERVQTGAPPVGEAVQLHPRCRGRSGSGPPLRTR